MRKGGESDPRNKSLMKMFNLINIGERSGSGVPNIFNTWDDEGWKEPVIEERFAPDRTILTLEFVEKQAIKTSDKKQAIKTSEENKRRKQAKKTSEENRRRKTSDNIEKICEYLKNHGESKTNNIADYLELSPSRTRAILTNMDNVEKIGTTTNRKYRLKN
jgi:predicted HTH transcriptional regulator